MNATADARIVGAKGEMVRAVPLRVVERPASLAASLGRPVLAFGTERDPFDVEGLQQEFRVVLPLGRCHQPLAQRLSIPMFGSGNMDMPEVPFGDELGLGIAGLLAKVAGPGIDRHERFGGDAGDMGQSAAESVLQRRLAPVALDACPEGHSSCAIARWKCATASRLAARDTASRPARAQYSTDASAWPASVR